MGKKRTKNEKTGKERKNKEKIKKEKIKNNSDDNPFLKRYSELGINTNIEIRKSLRVNTLKTTNEELIQSLKKRGIRLEKIKEVKNGFYYYSKFPITTTIEYLSGLFYIQEWPSQLASEILISEKYNEKISPDKISQETILDMAAAPGGKTTHLAQLMKNKGTIVAVDNKINRIKVLSENIERMGVKNVIIYKMNALNIERKIKFDRILLDAPCMGNFCNDANWLNKRRIQEIKTRQKIQRKLMKKAFELLKPKGILLYSTCSLEPEENELNVQWAMMNLNMELIDIKIPKSKNIKRGFQNPFGKPMKFDMSKTIRTFPPFFIALFRKIN